MGPKMWFINKTGSSREMPINMKEKLMADGWVPLPPDKLDAYGKPKQAYWPQYDQNSPTRERRVSEEGEIKDPRNVLEVESF